MNLQMAVNNSEGWGILQITTHLFGEYMLKKKNTASQILGWTFPVDNNMSFQRLDMELSAWHAGYIFQSPVVKPTKN